MAYTELAGKTVLVVDDEPHILFLLKRLLTTFDCQTITALNGLEAQQQYDQHQSDIALVITDMMMPDISGIDFIKNLRIQDPTVPIVVMSGMVTTSHPDNSLDNQNINAWISKPFTGTDLTQVVNDLFCNDKVA